MTLPKGKKIAVVGVGVAGITTAFLLQNKYDVTLMERNAYVGGHTNTVLIPNGADEGTAVDTGFIVLNDKTYPNFHKLLQKLKVPVRYSDMSFGFHSEIDGFEYAGTTINGLFSDRKNLVSPRFYQFLSEIRGFCTSAKAALKNARTERLSLGEFLDRERVGDLARRYFIIPMGAAIWSTPAQKMLEYPAETFLKFFENHGLLSLKDRPKWQTVVGGSFQYVQRFLQQFPGQILKNYKISTINRHEHGVKIQEETGAQHEFDAVVIATHADQALRLLGDPTEKERKNLGAWNYERNLTVLHTDISLLPRKKRSWASWNYREEKESHSDESLTVSYHMNRLQGLKTHEEYFVTLNPQQKPKPQRVIREINYMHPNFTYDSLETQSRIATLNGENNTYFCGSYMGYGFHEDAVKSALAVAKQFGETL